ncbi:hypothetical protein F5B22DRAFT_594284 [Xylaria bambusicola]|uniref:uncharacterized protein n=1 Tax=Xylaria bambusicola TaxID=326684 RepID=UPI002007F164|nr:uncharacterized protein F5B22DRAFT_594284 [Xylaria bambusicola]KAI0521838.1 hypothetical protein F5B22DRAFT_594284 [Xylaria bambusicola]
MDDHHLSLTSPGPAGIHHLERPLISFDLTPPAMLARQQANMNFTTREAHATGQDPLMRWYEVNDGPWHPPELTPDTGDGNGQSLVTSMRDTQYMVPTRSNMVPSEIMPQSDSGYGSYHNQPSIANGSVCGDSFDPNQDTRSIMGGSMVDAQFSVPETIPGNHMVSGPSCEPWPSHIRLETMTCPECGKPVRTKSELKKHHQRHKKPFKCDVADCARRIEGFSTTNDLDRHKRSVHPGSQTFGNRYVCQIGPCKNKDKIWPRADNFKAHLKRVHMKETVSDEDLESCIYKPPTSPGEPQESPRQEPMAGYGDYPGLSHAQTNSWPQFIEAAQSINQYGSVSETQVEETLSLSSSHQEHGNVQLHHAVPRQELYQVITESNSTCQSPVPSSSPMHQSPIESEIAVPNLTPLRPQMRQPSAEADDIDVNASEVSEAGMLDEYSEQSSHNSPLNSPRDNPKKRSGGASDSSEPERMSAPSTGALKINIAGLDLDDTTEMKKLVEVLERRGLLEQLGWRKDGSEVAEPAKAEADVVVNPSHVFPCSTCRKSFPRRCELKKHEKRHEKPYACTMQDCDKRFGSKNDWKRHENTQHLMLEMWKCDEERCEKHCPRREMFRAHLEKDHQITDPIALDARLEKCRVGKNYDARFWCGFCRKIIEIKQHGKQSLWAERFDHIDEHFSGRNDQRRKDISEWKEFDMSWSSKEDFGDEDETCPPPKHDKAQKPKRKRDDRGNMSNTKKARLQSRGMLCCHCGDLMTVSMLRCVNFPCEHIPCDNCKS